MYNPSRFKSVDQQAAFQLMHQNPFATLITVDQSNPIISHLPFTPEWQGDSMQIYGHMARANPHWRVLDKTPSTVIFQGANTYITPQWYQVNDVPTWNYSTVHLRGEIQLIEDFAGIIECLKKLSQHSEQYWPSGWQFFIPKDLTGEQLTKNIVGFKIQIADINFKQKLSQNRSAADREGIKKGLALRSDEASHKVLEEMTRLNL